MIRRYRSTTVWTCSDDPRGDPPYLEYPSSPDDAGNGFGTLSARRIRQIFYYLNENVPTVHTVALVKCMYDVALPYDTYIVFRVRAPAGPPAAARLVTSSRAARPGGHHHRRHSGDTTHFRCPSAWVAIQTLLRHVWRPKCGNPCGISPPAAPSPAKLRSWPPTRAVQGVSLAKIHGPAGPAGPGRARPAQIAKKSTGGYEG